MTTDNYLNVNIFISIEWFIIKRLLYYFSCLFILFIYLSFYYFIGITWSLWFKTLYSEPGVMAHAFNACLDADSGGSLWYQSQYILYSKFEVRWNYREMMSQTITKTFNILTIEEYTGKKWIETNTAFQDKKKKLNKI